MTKKLVSWDDAAGSLPAVVQAELDTITDTKITDERGTERAHQSSTYASYPVGAGELNTVALNYPRGDVRRYGAVGDGVADDTSAFTKAIAAGPIVLVPAGTYKITTALTFASDSPASGLTGVDRNKVILDFVNDTDGFVLSKAGVTIQGINAIGSSVTTSGVKPLASSPTVKDCSISVFGIGIDLAQSVHIVSALFENLTISYCRLYGVTSVATGSAQRNQIVFRKLYIVKCGTDADTLSTNATTADGHGMVINGGLGVTVDSCVFEYNTGTGLLLASNSYPLSGCSITAPYFERNKYANLYVSRDTYEINNLNITADTYSEAGQTPVANALAERTLATNFSNVALNGVALPNSVFGKYGYLRRNLDLRRPNFLNAFPVNFMADLSSRYAANIGVDAGETCLRLTFANPGVVLYDELAYIDSSFSYLLTYQMKKVAGTAVPVNQFILYDAQTSANLGNVSTYAQTAWTTVQKRFTFPSATRAIRFQFAVTAPPGDMDVMIKNIRLIPLLTAREGLAGSLTWDPASLVDGDGATSAAIQVVGALFGDAVQVAAPYDLQGITCSGYVSAADYVKIRLQNESGATVDLASGVWKVATSRLT